MEIARLRTVAMKVGWGFGTKQEPLKIPPDATKSRSRNLRCNYVWYDENLDMLQPKRTFWAKDGLRSLVTAAIP
jgi:hypothetical protein